MLYILVPKEVGNACDPCHADATDGKVRPGFSKHVWKQVQALVVGALLAPGKRTVTAVLRVMGLSQERHFENYHRVLNRPRW